MSEAEQFGTVYKRVMTDTRLPATAKAIYAYLCTYADKEGVCFPSNPRIVKELGLSRQTIEKHLEILELYAYISRDYERAGGRYTKRIINIFPPDKWLPDNAKLSL